MTRRFVYLASGMVVLVGVMFGMYRYGGGDFPLAAFVGKAAPNRPVLYYRDPTGKPDYSAEPKKDARGTDYIAVYDDDRPAVPAAAPAATRGRILYYRNPMGLADRSPVPKKDPMGMDYVPVYDGDEPDGGGTVKIGLAKVQRLGVRTEMAAPRPLVRTIHATGTIQPDERRLSVFSTRFEGWIEKLYVNATGQSVHRGDPVMDVYAPDLVAAQQEYLLASRTSRDLSGAGTDARMGVGGLVDAARQRLRNLGFTDEQFQVLVRRGAMHLVTLRAPADGIVLEKTAVEGMRFMPGDPLYRGVDLTTVWLIAEVYEQDLGAVHEGVSANVSLVAYPGAGFRGIVTFIYPTLARDSRTTKIRIELPNPDNRLKIDMFGSVEIEAPVVAGSVLAVPDSAVLDTGTRQTVLIDRGEGRFEPRAVTLGARANGYVEIREGLRAGEAVVVEANFLIDAESNMNAALRTFTVPDPDATHAGAHP